MTIDINSEIPTAFNLQSQHPKRRAPKSPQPRCNACALQGRETGGQMAQEMSGLFCTDSFTTDFIFIPFTTFIAPWLWESLRDNHPCFTLG